MSERKYRQRGYQDDDRARPQQRARTDAAPAPQRAPGRQFQDASGPRTPNLMASHEVFRCARCGGLLATPVAADARCSRCGVEVHSCINCVSFDTSARWECSQQTLAARVSPKDARNSCASFEPRTTVERETSTKVAPNSARQAFEDLFKI
ncbi:MAG: hypothetical protein AB7Q29_15660 [Vicinamibacterales bacterium]